MLGPSSLLSIGGFAALWLSTTSAFVPRHQSAARPFVEALWSAKSEEQTSIPAEIATKAVVQLYPALLEHKEQYGNPNIPLGTPAGRKSNQLRQMQIQGKLSKEEVNHLKEMGFLFHSLEDVYEILELDDMLPRLLKAKEEHGSLDIPKKYAPDPELGAYVTGIRRLGKERVNPDHVPRLDEIGFVWVSSRKCGGKFMQQYREIQQKLDEEGTDPQEVFSDPEVVKFVRAQKEAYKRKTLSETRIEYMTRLLGAEWWNEDKE